LTAIEKRDGTVILDLRSKGEERERGFRAHLTDSIKRGKKIIQSRISVHPSRNSATGISTIKFTKELANGEVVYVYHFTTTLTASTGFCPVVFGVCPRPDADALSFKRTNETIRILGDMDDWFTLYWAVFVSNRERTWSLASPDRQMQVRQDGIGDFNLVLFYSFLSVVPLFNGMIAAVNVPADRPFSPLNDIQSINFAKRQFSDMKNKMISSFLSPPSELPEILGTIGASTFFRIGVATSHEFQSWRLNIIARGLPDPQRVQRVYKSAE
jgi:hypothetical protein